MPPEVPYREATCLILSSREETNQRGKVINYIVHRSKGRKITRGTEKKKKKKKETPVFVVDMERIPPADPHERSTLT